MADPAMIFGWASSAWEKLISSGGRLFTALHGWDGSAWRKLPLLWGYSSHYSEVESAADVAAGDRNLVFSVVPAGEIWVIQGWVAFCIQNNITTIRFFPSCGGISISTGTFEYPTGLLTVASEVPIVLVEGDFLRVYFYACALNDDISSYAWGYKMKIAE